MERDHFVRGCGQNRPWATLKSSVMTPEVDMIDWLLDVLGFGQAQPGDEPEAGPVIIING